MATKLTAKEKDLIAETKQQEAIDQENLAMRVLARKRFQEYQPVVYQMLQQALKLGQVSHAYLFTGGQGCFKKEASILLAQSLFLDSEGFIEEETLEEGKKDIARRIADESYGDFLFFDGTQKEAIGRENILGIQELFAKTSLEDSDKKIYVIDHAENMSISAMNCLLKFLEEPSNNVYAILTTDNVERLLPTIISRCVVVPFRVIGEDVYYNFMIEEGVDPEDAFLLKRLVYTTNHYGDLVASKSYQTAKTMFLHWLGEDGDPRLFLVDYETRYRLKAKDIDDSRTNVKDANLDTLWMFFGMLMGFYRDVIKHAQEGPSWYINAIENAVSKPIDYAKMLESVVVARDRCNRTNDLNLVLDQAVYEMEAIKHVRI